MQQRWQIGARHLVLRSSIVQAYNTPDGWRSHRHGGRHKIVDTLLAEEAPNMAHCSRARLLCLPNGAHYFCEGLSTCSPAAGNAGLFKATLTLPVRCAIIAYAMHAHITTAFCCTTSSVPTHSKPSMPAAGLSPRSKCNSDITLTLHYDLQHCRLRAWRACSRSVAEKRAAQASVTRVSGCRRLRRAGSSSAARCAWRSSAPMVSSCDTRVSSSSGTHTGTTCITQSGIVSFDFTFNEYLHCKDSNPGARTPAAPAPGSWRRALSSKLRTHVRGQGTVAVPCCLCLIHVSAACAHCLVSTAKAQPRASQPCSSRRRSACRQAPTTSASASSNQRQNTPMRCPASGPDPNPAAPSSRAGRRTGAGRNAAVSVPAKFPSSCVGCAGRYGTLQGLCA